ARVHVPAAHRPLLEEHVAPQIHTVAQLQQAEDRTQGAADADHHGRVVRAPLVRETADVGSTEGVECVTVPADAGAEYACVPARSEVVNGEPLRRASRSDGGPDDLSAVGVDLVCRLLLEKKKEEYARMTW